MANSSVLQTLHFAHTERLSRPRWLAGRRHHPSSPLNLFARSLPRQRVCAERTDRVLQAAPRHPRERRLPANDEHRAGRRGGHVGARLAASGRLRSGRRVARSPERGGAWSTPVGCARSRIVSGLAEDWLGEGQGADATPGPLKVAAVAEPPLHGGRSVGRRSGCRGTGGAGPPKRTGGDAGGKCRTRYAKFSNSLFIFEVSTVHPKISVQGRGTSRLAQGSTIKGPQGNYHWDFPFKGSSSSAVHPNSGFHLRALNC